MAEYKFDYIIIKGSQSPTNPTGYYPITFESTRFIKSYDLPQPKFTDGRFRTLLNESSYEQVLIQTLKIRQHEVEIYFKENTNVYEIIESDKIQLVTRDGITLRATYKEASYELIEKTQMRVATFIFTENLSAIESLSNFVESNFVSQRTDIRTTVRLELSNNEDIGDFAAGETKTFYTIFYPIYDRETIEDDVLLTKTATGQQYTIRTYDCETISLKFFLEDDDLAIFRKLIKRCYYMSGSDHRGIKLTFNGTVYAEQTVNSDDITIGDRNELINITEVDVVLRRDFLRTEK